MATMDPPSAPPRRRFRILRVLILLLLLGIAALALWTWTSLHWAYSDGERAGLLQKFSRRGWFCKTQEGELALYQIPGVAPRVWEFSVRDPSTAAQLDKAVGQWVQLHYTEHAGVPSSCFADTRYFVDRVTTGQAPFSMGPAAPAPSPGGAPSGASTPSGSGSPPRP